MQTIDSTATAADDTTTFMKYFNDSDLFELFEFNFETCNEKCETLNMLLERDGFPIEKTPTNNTHIKFLRDLNSVKGISLNSNLYSKKEEVEE